MAQMVPADEVAMVALGMNVSTTIDGLRASVSSERHEVMSWIG